MQGQGCVTERSQGCDQGLCDSISLSGAAGACRLVGSWMGAGIQWSPPARAKRSSSPRRTAMAMAANAKSSRRTRVHATTRTALVDTDAGRQAGGQRLARCRPCCTALGNCACPFPTATHRFSLLFLTDAKREASWSRSCGRS
jgi:hypothetical protein